jgi:hypothetical protein
VITGVHAIVFSEDAERTRAFCRDTLRLESVDAGGGWLIFALPPAELAAHPSFLRRSRKRVDDEQAGRLAAVVATAVCGRGRESEALLCGHAQRLGAVGELV